MLDTTTLTKLFRSRNLSEREKEAIFNWNNATLIADENQNENQPNSILQYFDPGTIEIIFNLSSLALIAKVCSADGVVNSREFVAFTKAFRVPANALGQTAGLFRDACKETLGIDYYAKQTAKFISAQPNIRMNLLKSLIKIADADGIVNIKEFQAIESVAAAWKISSEVIKMMVRDHYCPPEIRPYDIMGLQKGFTFEELKNVYRKLSREFHPDKLQPQDYDESLLDIYRQRFSMITSSYRILTLQAKN